MVLDSPGLAASRKEKREDGKGESKEKHKKEKKEKRKDSKGEAEEKDKKEKKDNRKDSKGETDQQDKTRNQNRSFFEDSHLAHFQLSTSNVSDIVR